MLNAITEHLTRIETARFGPFKFQIGIDAAEIDSLFLRVGDAHRRFASSPLAQVAQQLEKEVVVTSIFGTNSIEGGTLSEDETQLALNLQPGQVQDIEQRRALNLKNAYDQAKDAAADPSWTLDSRSIRSLHAAITNDLPHPYNRPGQLRNNSKQIITQVGDSAHGGRYKPPQYEGDIITLLDALLAWHQQLVAQGVPALIRAPLVHLYFEQIHPFWDGNGRVGRVLEATLLLQEGFQYAPFAQATHYLRHIDQYFTLFNRCRKAAAKSRPHPNSAFIRFFLEGMLDSLNALHDRVNTLIGILLFKSQLQNCLDDKRINSRQHTIVSQLMNAAWPLPLSEVQHAPWYQSLYLRLTDKTRQRDLRGLYELELLRLDGNKRVWPGFIAAKELQA